MLSFLSASPSAALSPSLSSSQQSASSSSQGLHPPLEAGSVDTVLLLSVTKWLHFHHGDAGIRQVFALIDRALAPGGFAIVEPQPFASYKKKANLTPEIRARYAQIQLKPEQFPNYLHATHGWKLKHTFSTAAPPQQQQQATSSSSAAAAAMNAEGGGAASAAAPAVPPASGFQARPLYVFQKPH
jgi:hypothetical protein